MLSSPVEAVAASQRVSRQHHSTLILGGGGPSKSGKRAKCSLCGRNSQEVGFPLADLLYLHRKNCHFRKNKIALDGLVDHFSQLFLSLLLRPVILDRADGCCWKVLKDEKKILQLSRRKAPPLRRHKTVQIGRHRSDGPHPLPRPSQVPRQFRSVYRRGSITNCTKYHFSGHSIRPGTLFREGTKC